MKMSVSNMFEQQRAPQDWNSYLNPKYRFDNYFEGVSNKLVRSASEAIAQNQERLHLTQCLYLELLEWERHTCAMR